MSPILSIRNLSKSFGGARALDGVDFVVGPGEVHGLLGQNGSGKSTLIKILAGFHEPDPGAQLTVGGAEVPLPLSTGQFRNLGISFVHQHLGLVPSMSVLENLLIGEHAATARLRIPWRSEAARARALFQRFGLTLDPEERVERLSSVAKAQLAIVRAFDQLQRSPQTKVKILILDEPTPFLPANDVQKLFRLVRDLVNEGASVIFVSHDIDEVMEITDRVTVLRDGRITGTVETAEIGKDEIVRMIVGRSVDLEMLRPPPRKHGPVKVTIEDLHGPNLFGFSISLRAGEVVGLTGLIGSGYDDAVHLVYGAVRAAAGRLLIDQSEHELSRMTPDRAISAGVVLVPGDRLTSGVIATLSVTDNMTLPILGLSNGGWFILGKKMDKVTRDLNEAYDVRPRDPSRLVGQLSGGNQQKVVLAKWFQIAPQLILLDEPTQGVDIGAREQVFQTIQRMSEAGACVICASSDHEQLAALCDRVVVLARGRQVAQIAGKEISKSAIAELCYTSLETNGSPA